MGAQNQDLVLFGDLAQKAQNRSAKGKGDRIQELGDRGVDFSLHEWVRPRCCGSDGFSGSGHDHLRPGP